MVGGPAHGPRVDVVQLAACARARALVTLAILKEFPLAMSHRHRDGISVNHSLCSMVHAGLKMFTISKLPVK